MRAGDRGPQPSLLSPPSQVTGIFARILVTFGDRDDLEAANSRVTWQVAVTFGTLSLRPLHADSNITPCPSCCQVEVPLPSSPLRWQKGSLNSPPAPQVGVRGHKHQAKGQKGEDSPRGAASHPNSPPARGRAAIPPPEFSRKVVIVGHYNEYFDRLSIYFRHYITRPPAATKFWGRGFTRIFTDFYFFSSVFIRAIRVLKILADNANVAG